MKSGLRAIGHLAGAPAITWAVQVAWSRKLVSSSRITRRQFGHNILQQRSGLRRITIQYPPERNLSTTIVLKERVRGAGSRKLSSRPC
ncbi:hypothetical protein PoB_004708400 [Plakobranchus ocellatus]|uniref:Secreted protein n=1 Tax=Plakobranchus ocellatus TaxID=259542 RepID=A0AAV4BQH6_9GAST|nr:hypothetical protein PoB_004708400 [Plakobranchus ocellatus]